MLTLRRHALTFASLLALLPLLAGCNKPAPAPVDATPQPPAAPQITTATQATAAPQTTTTVQATPAPTPKLPSYMSRKLTPAEIEQFRGLPGVVRLSWKTQSEESNFGFNVMRGDNDQGTSFTKVNDRVIGGAGNSSTEHRYEFFDKNARVGEQYYYYLEDINFSGQRNKFSPVMPVKVQSINLEATTQTITLADPPPPAK